MKASGSTGLLTAIPPDQPLAAVFAENIFTFGLTADETQALRRQRRYRPHEYYERDLRVRRVVDTFRSNLFCTGEPDLFAWIYRTLLDVNDEFFYLADLAAYLEAQDKAATLFRSGPSWTRMAILNVARVGRFSSDRAVWEYARDIWGVQQVL